MKVLIVDDDVVSRMVLMHLIDSCGRFELIEAEDGADAWRQLEAGLRPAICFCDLRMPHLSGLQLLERVRGHASLAAMAFVLVSSANDSATLGQAHAGGASGYIVKPFQAEQVRSALAGLNEAGAGLYRHQAEAPAATLRRLGIERERLQAYLGGLQQQLHGAAAELVTLLAQGQQSAARQRIERLHGGCATLGLNGAAASLAALGAAELVNDSVQQALADAVRAAQHQASLLDQPA